MSNTLEIVDVKLSVRCAVCSHVILLDENESKYARYFCTVASIHVCDSCKRAIKWAKTQVPSEFE